MPPYIQRVQVIDSHTGGERTRVVLSGGPDLGVGPLETRLERFRRDHDRFRSATVNEPRGSEDLVGALLLPPADPTCAAAVIFFNNVGYLGMCGHGMIGLVVTLAQARGWKAGAHRVETPVGAVTATLEGDGSVAVENVESWRQEAGLAVEVPGIGQVRGDLAWGGNWFFLVERHGLALELANLERLTDYAWRVRQALNQTGHPEVDHVELFGPPGAAGSHSRNFVLCPGKAYDRSPCGTGTSAKLACLAADSKLAEGVRWVQESIVGSTFTGTYRHAGSTGGRGRIIPTIRGTAHVTAEATLLLDERDPFCWGIR